MKHLCKIFRIALFVLPCQLTFSQTLEIHTINVGHGDCTLIIVRDLDSMKARITAAGKTLPAADVNLLDTLYKYNIALEGTVKKAVVVDYGNGSKQGNKIATYLEKVGVDEINLALLSHNHKDHYGGFKTLIETNGFPLDTAYYRGNSPLAGTPTFKSGFVKVCTDAGAELLIVKLGQTKIALGSTTQNIVMIPVTSNGFIFKSKNTKTLGRSEQNDYGTSWILQYGGFRYFTGGDISGYSVGGHADVETPLTEAMVKNDSAIFKSWDSKTTLGKGHVCSVKMSHHGSRTSSNAKFLSVLAPQVAFISCGKSHGHPNIEVTNALIKSASVVHFFLTSLQKFTDARKDIGKATNKGIVAGNCVLVVDDKNISTESAFRVLWDGELDREMVSNPGQMVSPNKKGAKEFKCHKVHKSGYFPN
jgi:competence protein ComEC